ncbi:peptidase S41 family protein [Diplocarpon rosae]|nr:peptidase S41 family protein [Diplocarpon rosae]
MCADLARDGSYACAERERRHMMSTTTMLRSPNPAQPTVPAQLAFDCLQSVPNKPEPAAALVKSLKAFVQWQSTLAFLKDPPASYMLPPTDIEGGLDNISTTATTGRFTSEYDFQLSVVKLIFSAHDGHFAYRPDVFKAFGFRNNLVSDIVSVSSDGRAVPKLYHLGAVDGANATNTTASAITKINGIDAAKFIEDQNLEFSSFQDPDSQWNSVFQSYANPSGVLTLAASLAYQGSSVTVTYENGMEKTEQSFAVLRPGTDFSGIHSGEDYYARFCTPPAVPGTNTTGNVTLTSTAGFLPTPTSTGRPAPLPTIEGYPFPIVRDSGANITSGYFLNGTGYDSVAVLAVSAFAPRGDVGSTEYLTSFQSTVSSFLAQSKAAGKTKLVIDLQANGGGFVVAGYELFTQLFPEVQQFQANNLRLSDSLVEMAKTINAIPDNFTGSTDAERAALETLLSSVITSNIVPGFLFTPTGGSISSEDQILTPVSLKGDSFTAYLQMPLNQTSVEFNLTGTGTRSHPPASVFAPENIVILTDGTCGSTCTLFSYLMILQMKVKTTVIGGRPQTGVMQSIAGVEGAQVFPLDAISQAAAASIVLAPAGRQAELRAGELGTLADGYALRRLSSASNPGAINAKNAFSATDAQTPLQFLYQPANCRIFFTAQMLSSPELTWKRTVDATWTDPNKFCVEGSVVAMNQNSSQIVDPAFKLAVNRRSGMLAPQGAAVGSVWEV